MKTSTKEILMTRIGFAPLMTSAQVAEILGRTQSGLRYTLYRNASDFARALNRAKIKMGRRVMFLTAEVLNLIDAEKESPEK
ncbi:MAG: DNA-binding protein [Proteobacteria bacterium]|nr:DNA-binding protein [Pseudomonadota bacterium]